MEDCIESLGDPIFFTALYALWGYWRVPIEEGDLDKTTFTSHMPTFQYSCMTFGLRNALATFHRALHIILARVRWRICLI